MRDWYQLNPGNPEHWFYATRKLIDPAFMGPKGAKLAFDVVTSAPGNCLAVGLELNTWQNYTGRKQDSYHAIVNLPEEGVNKVELSPADFRNKAGESPGDWDEVTELTLTPSRRVVDVPEAEWKGNAPELANLRWIGGEDGQRPIPTSPVAGKRRRMTGRNSTRRSSDPSSARTWTRKRARPSRLPNFGRVTIPTRGISRKRSFPRKRRMAS